MTPEEYHPAHCGCHAMEETMPDSSTRATPSPPESDCTCSHITGDAYCARHGEPPEPCPSPDEVGDTEERYIRIESPGEPATFPEQAPYARNAREEPERQRDRRTDAGLLTHMGTDAARWADEYQALHGGDWGTLVGWFANAIESGRSAGYAAGYTAGHVAGEAEWTRPIGETPTCTCAADLLDGGGRCPVHGRPEAKRSDA